MPQLAHVCSWVVESSCVSWSAIAFLLSCGCRYNRVQPFDHGSSAIGVPPQSISTPQACRCCSYVKVAERITYRHGSLRCGVMLPGREMQVYLQPFSSRRYERSPRPDSTRQKARTTVSRAWLAGWPVLGIPGVAAGVTGGKACPVLAKSASV